MRGARAICRIRSSNFAGGPWYSKYAKSFPSKWKIE
jgi:hypothetical protein